MAKNKVSEWSSTPASNTDVGGVDIAEGCAPSGINNAIRDMMSQIKDMQTGADGDNFAVGGNLAVTGTTTATGAITANGGVTGNLTGNVTGNVTGDVSGNAGTVTNGVYLSATQTLTNKTFTGYTETVFAVSGTTPALSPNNGTIQTWTLSANSTPTAGTWGAGQSMTLMINDGTAYTVTWTSLPVTWVGGTAPTLALTGFTVIVLWKVGTTIYGTAVGDVA